MRLFSSGFPATALALATCAAGAEPAPTNQALLDQMNLAWETAVATFYSPRTSLFYSQTPDQVPTAEQYARCEPNRHAGGTAGEDCAMFGGILLAAMCDQYEVTGDPAVGVRAAMVYDGLKLLATVHGEPGFIARGVCVQDGKSIYPGSSRDQFTHVVHGLWRFYHSPLSNETQQQAIREILCAVADKMTRDVTPENNYCFKFPYSAPDDRGVSKMWEVRVHEAARLPMLYAAAWDVGRQDEHHRQYRQYLAPAVEQSLGFPTTPVSELKRWVPAYSILQMQASLELLLAVETNAAMQSKLRQALRQVAEYVETSPAFSLKSRGGRERAEVIEGQLLSPDYALTAQQQAYLTDSIARLQPATQAGPTYTLLGAYWRARREGALAP